MQPTHEPSVCQTFAVNRLKMVNGSNEAWYGGADWNRTSDPLLAKQVLSQLSYSPILNGKSLFLISRA